MKITRLAEETREISDMFDASEFSYMRVSDVQPAADSTFLFDEKVLDNLLAAVKWIFLFVPGVAAIHCFTLATALTRQYNGLNTEMLRSFGFVGIFATFMIMLGIGKLTDLRYLRVVGGILAASGVAAVIYTIISVVMPGNYFGAFMGYSLLFTVLTGYLVKRQTDRLVARLAQDEMCG